MSSLRPDGQGPKIDVEDKDDGLNSIESVDEIKRKIQKQKIASKQIVDSLVDELAGSNFALD